MITRAASRLVAASACAIFALNATAQLRVATWNISNYAGGRTADIQTAVYGVFEGRTLAPDVIIGQEFLSAAAVTAFRTALNTAPGSPGDWAAATFVDGPDTDSAFFYRTTRVQLVSSLVVAIGSSSSSNQPRHTMRYDFRPVGYAANEATIGAYSVHMKAGDASADQARRLIEAQRIRDNAEGNLTDGPGLPAGYAFLVAGDFNIQSAFQAAYQELVGEQPSNAGRFFDPISSAGSWNNNSAYRFIHTQDPAGAGGMDDRHDQILISGSLIDSDGLAYIGSYPTPYSTTTWNDPNHSYRSWGNDGSSYNLSMAIASNTMVGPSIAQALVNCANGAGHLPVVLNLRVPAVAETTASIDFGTVNVGDPASQTLSVWNDADAAKWTASGIDDLNYSLATTAGFTAPAGSFVDAAGGSMNTHSITMDTSTPGVKSGTITITSDAPDQPAIIVSVTGEVVEAPSCPSDVNGDGESDVLDFLDFMDAFGTCENQPAPCGVGPVNADFNGDTTVDVLDFLDFFDAFGTGCD